MKVFVMVLGLVLGAQFAHAADNCSEGKIGDQTYKITNSNMDDYGRFTSTLELSNDGVLKGKGLYVVSEGGEEAYLETKYRKSLKSGKKAVVSISFGGEGSFMTLCLGTDLEKTDQYTCTSCVKNSEQN